MNQPLQIAENYIEIGVGKTKLSIPKMLLLGIMAGMFIALAGVGCIFGNAYVNKALGAAIFPAGLAMVIICGSELFTGNCLMIIPVLTGDTKVIRVLKNWLFVYIGNLIGAMLVAALASLAGTFDAENVLETVTAFATAKVSMTFGAAFVRGILCNILVCLAVWIAFAAKTVAGKIIGVFFPIWIFVFCGFEHSVADMFYVPAGLFMGVDGVSWSGFFVSNLIPVTLGNIVGGCFIGFMYWAIYLKKKKA